MSPFLVGPEVALGVMPSINAMREESNGHMFSSVDQGMAEDCYGEYGKAPRGCGAEFADLSAFLGEGPLEFVCWGWVI